MLYLFSIAQLAFTQDESLTTSHEPSTLPEQFTTSSFINGIGMVFVDDPKGYPTEKGSFFDFYSYDKDQPCYEDIAETPGQTAFSRWAVCCMDNETSVNCKNYNPSDVCFNAVEPNNNELAIYAGKFGWYPTVNWANCCSIFCEDELVCNNSLYCRSYVPGWEQWWPTWLYYCVIITSFMFCMSFFLLAICCCGFCGFKKSKPNTVPLGVPPQQPQVIYVQAVPPQLPNTNEQTVQQQYVFNSVDQKVVDLSKGSVEIVGGADSDDTNVVLRPYHETI